MKKDVLHGGDADCQNAFDSIKAYLVRPPILASPVKGIPLVLYIIVLKHYLGVLPAKENVEGKGNALYYLN